MTPNTKRLRAADLFCGAGGTSTGMLQACEEVGAELDLLAINHDEHAIGSHSLNHPNVRHLCADLGGVNPRTATDGKLHILAASPECQNQGCARGGLAINDQSRATAYHVSHWVDATQPEAFIIENVPGIVKWGPLNARRRPIKARQGELFNHWIEGLRLMGYTVDWRRLNSADYGDATARERLIILGLRGKRQIHWPHPSHAEKAFNGYKQWRAAREIIDWECKGKSIFNRKKPLAESTLKQIREGLRRFGGQAFLLGMEHGQRSFSLERPFPTVTTADAWALVEPQPFLVKLYGTGRPQSLEEPLPTITAGGQHLALVEPQPFLVKYYGTGTPQPVTEPLGTITTADRFALVEPRKTGDILFRMLNVPELAAAMSFPAGYQFTGTREKQVWQIGNAVPIKLAKAVTRAQLRAAFGLN